MNMAYEALQEAQPEGSEQAVLSQDNMTGDDWIDVGISLVITFLLAALIIMHYPQFNNKSQHHSMANNNFLKKVNSIPQETIQSLQASNSQALTHETDDYKLKHVLNGVFVSDQEKVAMVNNRFFNIGDSIDGMQVVNIEPDKITLKNTNGIIELKVVV